MLVGGRRLRNSAFCDRMDENVNIIERVVNGARMDIIEPVTDSDQVRIFTPEVVRELIKGLTIRELYPEERIRPLTLDDIEVHVFRKRKGRRSSGEILIVKGSIGESPLAGIMSMYGTGNQNTADFSFVPNACGKSIQEYQKQGHYDNLMSEADDEYKRDFYASIANLPSFLTRISITHDFKSFSIQKFAFSVSRNRHYTGKRVVYSYKPVDFKKTAFFKQERKGADSYYLKYFGGISIRIPETPLTFAEMKDENEIVERALKLFFNDTECQDTEAFYNQKTFPVVSKALKMSDAGSFLVLNKHPGWVHGENTLTQAIQKSIGSKPRKDFVREIGRIARIGASEKPSSIHSLGRRNRINRAAEIISGSLFLASLTQYADLGFDIQDTIVKRLQKVRTLDDMAKVPFRALSYDCVYSSLKSQNIILTCVAFHKLGPTLTRTILMGELGVNDLTQIGDLTVMNDYRSVQEIGSVFLFQSALDAERIEKIRGNMYSGKRNIVAWIQEAKEAVDEVPFDFNRTRNNFDFNEHNYPDGYYPSFGIVHDVVMRGLDSLREAGEREKRKVPFPANPLSDYVIPETIYNNEKYTFSIPKNPDEVIKWANILNNCMGSYSRMVNKEMYAFVFVKKNEKPYAALGLRQKREEERVSYTEEQFYRTNNMPLPLEEQSRLWKEMFSIEGREVKSDKFSIKVG